MDQEYEGSGRGVALSPNSEPLIGPTYTFYIGPGRDIDSTEIPAQQSAGVFANDTHYENACGPKSLFGQSPASRILDRKIRQTREKEFEKFFRAFRVVRG
jgi:hypothetical protein